ncbi:MAG: hypothetical protein MJ116_11600 [Lachnospiraceae bacterium]|nr:hypothetical protein [Lachnospiraceae bacterium]
MKKNVFCLFTKVMPVVLAISCLTACASFEAAEGTKKVASDDAKVQSEDPDTATRLPDENGTKIRLTFGDTVIFGVLNDSETAKALIEKLPYTQQMSRYSHDFCGVTEELPYQEENVHYGWLNGDIDYATNAPYFTILFEDEERSEQYDYQVNIGVVTSPLSEISALDGSYDVLIEKADDDDDLNEAGLIPGYSQFADYVPVLQQGEDLGTDSNSDVLVAYFSRSGNTEITEGIDAVSSASLQIEPDGTTLGNCERVAGWIADEADADRFLIRTEYSLPVDYDQVVDVGEGMDIEGYRPKLAAHIEDISHYDTIVLVAPVWHYTLPQPVYAFLDEYDLSGKKIVLFGTNAGSGFADQIACISREEPEAEVVEGITLRQNEVEEGEEAVREAVRRLLPQTVTDQSEEVNALEKNLKLVIDGQEVPVTWEDNDAVSEITESASENGIHADLHMYGGWEQVGSLGRSFSRNDKQITTRNGDIVLYSGDQIVLFYGPNSWSYTKLGHIELSEEEITALLDKNHVSLTLEIN